MNRVYETERLRLVVVDSTYASKILKFYLENESFLMRWEQIKQPDFYSINHQRRILNLEEQFFMKGQMVRFWIFKREDETNDEPIGSVSLTNIIRGVFQSCFLGYKLGERFTGAGYMTEAISKVMEVAFDEMELHRIEANIMPDNMKSMNVVKRLGFENEGLARKYLKINGKWEDHYHMVKLNEYMI
jgi:ribosomal-protein-alanine N-acetyltransferase